MVNIDDYLGNLGASLQQLPLETINHTVRVLHHARLNGKQVFIMGNGGSASTSTHFVCDLAKNNYFEGLPPFRAIDLTSSNAIFTALANDEGFENVFSHQLRNMVEPNDIVIAISTSGNSPNILQGVALAKEMGAIIIGFTGYEGGRLAALSDVEVRVPSDNIRHIEDIHMIIAHLISFALYEISRDTVSLQVDTRHSFHSSNNQNGSESPVKHDDAELFTPLMEQTMPGKGKHANTSMLFQFLRMLLEMTKTQSGTLIVTDEQGNLIDGAQIHGGKTVSPSKDQLQEVSRNGLAGWVVKNGKAAIVDSTNADDRWLRRPWENDPKDDKSALSVPIKAGNLIGCITLVRPWENRFSIKDLELVTHMTTSLEPVLNKPPEDE